jgi:pimeloyl-ACP methyl ester carboxylesterase
MPFRLTDPVVDVDGVRLECRWIGPPPDRAPTVVMLHEGLGSVAQWKDFPAQVADVTGCGVFAYSRQGYGGSDPVRLPRPLSYMHDEALKVLPRLLDEIGFIRGLLFGHSDGASIATIYAGGVEDHRVRGLVLLAPHFFVEALSLESIRQAKQAYETGDLRDRLRKYHGDNVDGAFRGWNYAWLHPDFGKWDITEYLAYVRVPILIVQGEDDPYGTPRQVEVAESECYCPVESVLLPGCGHAPQLDRPEATLAAIRDFAERLFVTHGEAAPLRLTA